VLLVLGSWVVSREPMVTLTVHLSEDAETLDSFAANVVPSIMIDCPATVFARILHPLVIVLLFAVKK
jgi:hypothetical protein